MVSLFDIKIKYFDDENINDANLFLFQVDKYESVKYEWESYDESAGDYDGLEIPVNLNWHNGKSFNNPNNYFNIHLIAIRNWAFLRPSFSHQMINMTDLKNRRYHDLTRLIGRLIYSQENINENEILLFRNVDVFTLRSFKHKAYDKSMEEFQIVGIKLVKYNSFPRYFYDNGFIDVLGPKETFFIENED